MQDLKSDVYKVVAMPKQFLWAPFEMAILNIMGALIVMILCVAVLDIVPFLCLVPLCAGHAMLIHLGTRDPHIFTVIQATGKYQVNKSKHNISRVSRGVKYVP